MIIVSGATVHQQYPELPTDSAVVDNPEAYIGENVLLEGRVVEVDPVMIDVKNSNTQQRFTLVGSSMTVEPDAEVEVYGTVEDTTTVHVIEVVTVTKGGLWYAYSISFIAVIWVLIRLWRQWEFNRQELGLRPRTGSIEEKTSDANQKEQQNA